MYVSRNIERPDSTNFEKKTANPYRISGQIFYFDISIENDGNWLENGEHQFFLIFERRQRNLHK